MLLLSIPFSSKPELRGQMRKPILRFPYIYVVSIVSVFSFTCHEPTQVSDNGNGLIIPGTGVEGIKLGDTKETVELKLGKPTSVGWADGLIRSWRIYRYSEGTRVAPKIRLQFYFIDDGGDYGPIDWIGIGEAYEGKTKEGIGIGSLISVVHQTYGQPAVNLYSEGITIEKYCVHGKKFEIDYSDSIIVAMSTGYLVPVPQDDPCE